MKYSWAKGLQKFAVGFLLVILTQVITNWDIIVSTLPEKIQSLLQMTVGGLILWALNFAKQWLKSKD